MPFSLNLDKPALYGSDKYGASDRYGAGDRYGSSIPNRKENSVIRQKSVSGGRSDVYSGLRDRTSSNESSRSGTRNNNSGSSSPKKYARVGSKEFQQLKRLDSQNSQKSDKSFEFKEDEY